MFLDACGGRNNGERDAEGPARAGSRKWGGEGEQEGRQRGGGEEGARGGVISQLDMMGKGTLRGQQGLGAGRGVEGSDRWGR